jgi:hypothetical protein
MQRTLYRIMLQVRHPRYSSPISEQRENDYLVKIVILMYLHLHRSQWNKYKQLFNRTMEK